MLLTYSGRPLDALAVLGHASRRRPGREPARCGRSPRCRRWSRPGGARPRSTAAGRAFAEHAELPDQIAIPGPGVHIITRIYALAECGRLAEAGRAGRGGVRRRRRPTRAARRAHVARAPAGPLRAARRAGSQTAGAGSAEALARCEEHDIVGPRRLVLSAARDRARLRSATPTAAAAAVRRARPASAASRSRRPSRSSAGRWALVVAGDLPGARQVLQAAAELAAAAGYRSRRGVAAPRRRPTRRPERRSPTGSRSWPRECEGDLVAAYADARRGRAAGRRRRAGRGGRSLRARSGALLLAAEAATEAAQAFQRAGDRRAAAALGRPGVDAGRRRAKGPGRPA